MDKFELLCLLEAISNYAYDIHYTAKGRYFFSDHLFSERLSDVDVKDDFIETFYLGKSEEAPSSADIARKVATLTPQISENTQDNFKRLRDLIIRALMTIQKYDGTKGEEDILGAIAHILQRHNGLLYRQLIYTPEEIRNDNSDWRDIVSEEELRTKKQELYKKIYEIQQKETNRIQESDEYKRLKKAQEDAEEEYYKISWSDYQRKNEATGKLEKTKDDLLNFINRETDKAFERLKDDLKDLNDEAKRYEKAWAEKYDARMKKEREERAKKEEEKRQEMVEKAKEWIHPETIAGVKRGNPMSRDEANGGNVNPHYSDGNAYHEGYRTNCQSCVVVYEARLRGYDVEVLPKTKGSKLQTLSYNSAHAWIDLNTGDYAKPEVLFSSNSKKIYKELEEKVEKNNRYEFRMCWKGENNGHVVSVGKDEKGLYLYDPQSGKTFYGNEMMSSYLDKISVRGGEHRRPWLLRVDDKAFSPEFYNYIMKKKS